MISKIGANPSAGLYLYKNGNATGLASAVLCSIKDNWIVFGLTNSISTTGNKSPLMFSKAVNFLVFLSIVTLECLAGVKISCNGLETCFDP